jgi:hypothetical protein
MALQATATRLSWCTKTLSARRRQPNPESSRLMKLQERLGLPAALMIGSGQLCLPVVACSIILGKSFSSGFHPSFFS